MTLRAIFLMSCIASVAMAFPSLQGKDLATGRDIAWKAGTQMSVVVFLSPLCPCSQSHEKSLRKLAEAFPSVQFLGVVSNALEPEMQARAHFTKAALPFPIIEESHHAWADSFGALNTPHAFVFDSKGDLLFQGGVDNSRDAAKATRQYLEEALGAMMAGRSVEVKQARPLGCAIRR